MTRIYLLWIYVVTLTAFIAASMLTMIEAQRLSNNTTSRITNLADNIEDKIIQNYSAKRLSRIAKLTQDLRVRNELNGIAICDIKSNVYLGFPKGKGFEFICQTREARKAFSSRKRSESKWILPQSGQRTQYLAVPMNHPKRGQPTLFLVISQDLLADSHGWLDFFLKSFFSIWGVGMILILLVTPHLRQWVTAVLGRGNVNRPLPGTPLLAPPQTLFSDSLKECLSNQKLVVIANRAPYIHQYNREGKIEVMRPASGLVTALEPILRHLGGLWIAHGSGSADMDTANSIGEVAVPPGNPKYTLRRVALSKEEELGYYYGFSNEGLWPLCHLAHNRPIFRLSDWEHYKSINQRFTDAIPTSSFTRDTLILVQDYHFGLVPKLIRKRIDNLQFDGGRIGLFWHIPWPNPEAFGICPWSKDLLHGMLGADVIGFHTQYHCNNFLETCNRYLEARIDWEHFSVTMGSHETYVRAFPIGIDPTPVRTLSDTEIEELKSRYGIRAQIVAVGVDRLDYTKGLIERIEGVERFLEKYPQYVGKFTFAQMGSPSRTHIPAYRSLADQLELSVRRVNQRFGNSETRPVVFLHQHYDWEQIQYFYQIGDMCLVTSLHDGMNLVAKEYVWCQRPEKGALILSKFTGASRELTEAFIINPYSTEELADTIAAAISLPAAERTRRMLAMKEKIEGHSAFHWAEDLIRALMTKGETFVTQLPTQDRQDRYQLTKAS